MQITPLHENSISPVPENNFKCRDCKKETKLHCPEKAEVFCCPKCTAVYTKKDGAFERARKDKVAGLKPIIPLQSVCEFYGKKYTVVAYAKKKGLGKYYAVWEEYTLITANKEIAYLNQSYGHWSLFTPGTPPPDYTPKASSFKYRSLIFDLIASYKQKTAGIMGEFYYNVADVSSRVSREYTNPPHIFTHEQDEERNDYFDGIYITESKLRNAFEAELTGLPEKDGVGDYQPFYFGIKPGRFGRLSLIVIILAFVAHFFYAPSFATEIAYPKINAELNDSIKTVKKVSESFKVEGDRPIELTFKCDANINNDWIEAAITLINDNTGEEKSFVTGMEFYTGVDVDGNWTEGGFKKTEYVGNVQPGTYHLETEVYSSGATGRTKSFNADVTGSTASNWNFWSIMGIYGCITIIIIVVGANFDDKR